MKRGLFIAFEGIDGCGKSTQVTKLAKHILDLDKHNHVLITREPYKNRDIRKILQAESNPYSQAENLAELFVKDRKEHLNELILPTLNQGAYVITDRYSLSTLAYQQTQGVPLEKLISLHKNVKIPDIVFLVDLPVKTALERMRKDSEREIEQKFEKEVEFIQKLRQNYLDLLNLPDYNIIKIDGTESIEEIFERQIKPSFDKFYLK